MARMLDSIEEDFVTWKEKLWHAVCERFGLDASAEDERSFSNE